MNAGIFPLFFLPEDLIWEVLSFVNLYTKFRCLRACKWLMNSKKSLFLRITEMTLEKFLATEETKDSDIYPILCQEKLALCRRLLPNITSVVNTEFMRFDKDSFDILLQFWPSITKIIGFIGDFDAVTYQANPPITDLSILDTSFNSTYANLANFTTLKTLIIHKPIFIFEGFRITYITQITSLTSLSLRGLHLEDKHLIGLSHLTCLKTLDLSGAHEEISIEDVPNTLVNLENLNVGQCKCETIPLNKSLAHFSRLTNLELNKCPSTVSQLTSLTRLVCGFAGYKNIIPSDMNFKPLTRLRYLDVTACYDLSMKSLLDLTSVLCLRILNIKWLRMTNGEKNVLMKSLPNLHIISNYDKP